MSIQNEENVEISIHFSEENGETSIKNVESEESPF